MGSRSRVKTSPASSKAIDWLRDASPDEIADALLAVDEEKAALVVVRLVGKTEGEVRRLLDGVGREFDADPVGTLARSFFGTISRINRGG